VQTTTITDSVRQELPQYYVGVQSKSQEGERMAPHATSAGEIFSARKSCRSRCIPTVQLCLSQHLVCHPGCSDGLDRRFRSYPMSVFAGRASSTA